jgi:hypothetical protein
MLLTPTVKCQGRVESRRRAHITRCPAQFSSTLPDIVTERWAMMLSSLW